MLIKLRNRFLAIIMSFTAITLAIAFVAIYYFTYMQINISNNEKLYRTEKLIISENYSEFISDTSTKDELSETRIFPQYGVYFNLVVDEKGKLVHVDSALEIPTNVYAKAAAIAWNGTQKTVEFANRKWHFAVGPATIDINGQVNESDYYTIRFLDITESQKTLSTLAITLLVAGVIILTAFYFLGVYFSNRAIKPTAESLERQEQFLSDASHELKTPLSIISASTEVLYASREESIESQIKWVDNIKSVVVRMTGLINSLLSLSRIESKNDLTENKLFDMSTFSISIIQEYELLVKEKNIDMCQNIASNITLKSNRELVGQVFRILLDNAIKYTEQNGRIDIELKLKKGKTILSVKNSHRGIGTEELSKLFDRFYRVDTSRKSDENNYGLGLPIAKSIMDNLGGAITVDSSINDHHVTFAIIFSS